MTEDSRYDWRTGALTNQVQDKRIIRYPHPFFDVSRTYQPTSIKEMLEWCRFYFMSSGLIHATVTKMATYPLTELLFEDKDEAAADNYKEMFDDILNIMDFQIDMGIDHFALGNGMASISFPFRKMLICPQCKGESPVKDVKYRWINYSFLGPCPKCKQTVRFAVRDDYIKSPKETSLVRWNPEDIGIDYNPITGKSIYSYHMPPVIKTSIMEGKKSIIEDLPTVFIDAVRRKGSIIFRHDNLFHFRRPSLSQRMGGWGTPLPMPILRDVFYLQILKKANEAIALEHIVPLRMIFPAGQTEAGSVYSSINLAQWRAQVEKEILRWRRDPNYIPIFPLPVGTQSMGGQGRALMLTQEIELWSRHIISGMLAPQEFVFGGLCASAETLVPTSKGLLTLGEICPTTDFGSETSSGLIGTHHGPKEITHAHAVGYKKAARLQTKLGLEMLSAHTHPMLVLCQDLSMQFKPVADILPGDHVAVLPGADMWATEIPSIKLEGESLIGKDVAIPEQLTPELARLLGYLIAEGSLHDERRVGFGNIDTEVIKDFVRCVEAVFGYTLNVWEDKTARDRGYKPFFQTEISRKKAVTLLTQLGAGGYSHEKTVPKIIRIAPKSLVTEFLRGYFEGDGGVTQNKKKQTVYAISKSKELLSTIQLLLLNMGIVSSLYPTYRNRSTYGLQIRSSYVDVFAEEVGFVSSTKRAKLKLRTPTKLRSHDGNKIPYLKDLMRGFRDQYFHNRSPWKFDPVSVVLDKEDYSVREAASLVDRDTSTLLIHIRAGKLLATKEESVGGQFSGYRIKARDLKDFLANHGLGVRKAVPTMWWEANKEKMVGKNLSFVREKDPGLADRIEALIINPLIWDKVVEVELLDIELPMKDITVAEVEAYQGNGIISHNSYSGSSVSLRMLENMFLSYRRLMSRFHRWTANHIATFFEWPRISIRMTDFKMADDMQKKQIMMSLNQQYKISDTSLLSEFNMKFPEELKKMKREMNDRMDLQKIQGLANAELQGETMIINAKYQKKLQDLQGDMMSSGIEPPQSMMNEEQAAAEAQRQGGVAVDPQEAIRRYASQLKRMPDAQRAEVEAQMQSEMPELYQQVQAVLQEMEASAQAPQQQPMPEQKPPRRDIGAQV